MNAICKHTYNSNKDMETNIKIKKLHSNRVIVKLNQLVDIIAQLTLL